MATPLSADRLLSALIAEGVNAREYRSWRTHNRNHMGPWGGVNGVVIHHTAGRDSLELCYNGTSSLPGPLCHTHLSKSGVASMISAGRANHAGSFARNAHNAVVNESSTHPRPDSSEPIDGNAHYYGIEVENLGNGTDEYPAEQYDQAVRWAAAICRAHGWSADSVIGHKEGTTRKIDPKGPVEGRGTFDMGTFRADVGKRLARPAGGSAPTNPTKPEADPMTDAEKIADAVGARKVRVDDDTELSADTLLRRTYVNVNQDSAKLNALAEDVAELAETVAELRALIAEGR